MKQLDLIYNVKDPEQVRKVLKIVKNSDEMIQALVRISEMSSNINSVLWYSVFKKAKYPCFISIHVDGPPHPSGHVVIHYQGDAHNWRSYVEEEKEC